MRLFRRRYGAWLGSALQKESLSREDFSKILQGQLLLPAKKRDAALMLECTAALDGLDGETYPLKEDTWWRIASDIGARRASFSRRRRAVLALALVLTLLLAAAAVAAFSPKVFSFLMGEGSLDSYVQQDAAGLLKTNLGQIRGEHVEITITEAAYDGQELRLVYSIRDLSGTRMWSDEEARNDAGFALRDLAGLDNFNASCDWVTINGQDVELSDCGQKGGDKPGEILYYLQALLGDQDMYPTGSFTVGLPLARRQVEGSLWPRAFVPPELTFTLNADEATKKFRHAVPAEITSNGVRIELTKAAFSPVAGAVYLRVTGDDQAAAEKTAGTWWMQAQLYTRDGARAGICSAESMSAYIPEEGISIKLDVVPPEEWPEDMILALPDPDGKPSSASRIPIVIAER